MDFTSCTCSLHYLLALAHMQGLFHINAGIKTIILLHALLPNKLYGYWQLYLMVAFFYLSEALPTRAG